MVSPLRYTCNPLNCWNKTQIKKLLWFKRRAFIAESISVKRFNFVYFNFPGKFLLSYNTAMVYTGCYQCNPLNSWNKTQIKKLLWFKRRAFIAESISVKRFNFAYFNFPGKFLLSYNTTMVYTVHTISFERPVNYLCDAWHVFSPKYKALIFYNN